MWLGGVAAAFALSLAAVSAPVSAQTPYEAQVLAALNFARTDPAGYAETLRKYRTYFRANLVRMPGLSADIETSEGVAVVDETIGFLGRQAPLTPIADAQMFEQSASDHVADQGATGQTGHEGSDGSSPGDRVRKRGGGLFVAELIAYGPIDAIDAVRQLIVDDGVSDRGHRSIIYSPDLKFAGVSCGPHPQFRTMCVIDLGMTPDGHVAGRAAAGRSVAR